MKETREMSYFKETMEKLAQRQNECRDRVLDLILNEDYDDVDKTLKILQTVSVGIQVCQQTIQRDSDRVAAEEQRKLRAIPTPPPEAITEEPKKKGWFRR